ncbi:DUF7344 domain-containing protein [Haladaptatus sp. DFWS20]|uniref:DUF7344 domain-containing protein n=1 Tax=Haladaptatus sp. DFWS20 TaxID=3403467 RepID=UPI003EB9D194
MSDDGFELLIRKEGAIRPLDEASLDSDQPMKAILEILANERRRCIIYYLREHESAVVDTLIDHVRAHEWGGSPVSPDPSQRERLRVELLHAHLPKLENAGVVEFERTGEYVEYVTASETFELFVQLAESAER